MSYARPLSFPTGNDAARNRPLSPPRGVPGSSPVNSGSPGQDAVPGVGFVTPNIFQPTNFGSVQMTNHTLILATKPTDILLIEPPDIRAFFSIRLASSATGVLGIAFNAASILLDECAYVLSPGGLLMMDTFIPQNRIYGTIFGGDGKVIVAYSNAGARS